MTFPTGVGLKKIDEFFKVKKTLSRAVKQTKLHEFFKTLFCCFIVNIVL